jgi:hypothetical protein
MMRNSLRSAILGRLYKQDKDKAFLKLLEIIETTQQPAKGKYSIGDNVMKIGTGYTGPGEVRGIFEIEDGGSIRYAVRHRIEGGNGWLLHIYSETQLKAIPEVLNIDVKLNREQDNVD